MTLWEVYKALQDIGRPARLKEIVEQVRKNAPVGAMSRDAVADALCRLKKQRTVGHDLRTGHYSIIAPFPERNVYVLKTTRSGRMYARRVKVEA